MQCNWITETFMCWNQTKASKVETGKINTSTIHGQDFKSTSHELILWSARNAKRRLSLPKDKMMVMIQVTDQRWVSKCNNKGVTQIIAISYTFLQTWGAEVVLWRLHYPPCTSEHRHWVEIHKPQLPPKIMFANTGDCVLKTAGLRLTAGRDKVHMAEFRWRGWHRPKGCQKGLDCFLNITKGLKFHNQVKAPWNSNTGFCIENPESHQVRLIANFAALGKEKKKKKKAGEIWGRALFLH